MDRQDTIQHHAAEAHGFNPCVSCAHPRHRGVAMLLVLIAVAIATVLSMSFLASQASTHGVAQNVQKHAQARSVAESALVAAIHYAQTDADFRSDKTHGQWASDVSFNGGTFDLFGYDGLDTDGDGVVDDTDGDLADDTADPVTITAIGYYDGVSHTVHAVVTPGSGSSMGKLLFVVEDDASLAAGDVKRKAFFEDLGWTVTPIDDDSTQVEFDAAVADSVVVYISETVNSHDVGTAFTTTSIGVVDEERLLHDEFEFASSGASTHTAQTIDITDNTHYITSPFPTGSLQVASTGIVFIRNNSTIGPGAQVLATNGTPTLFVFDTGDELEDGSSAAGRRVALFIGDTDMDFDTLTDDGKTIVQRSLTWAAASSGPAGGVYDYATRTQGTDIWAYAGEDASDPPTNNTTPASELSPTEYDDIEADDSGAHAVTTTQNGRHVMIRCVIQIDEDEADVSRLDATVTGSNINTHGPRTDGLELMIWNYATGSYEQLAVSADTESEVTLEGGVGSDLADYIGGASSDTVTLLVMSRDKQTANKDNTLNVDYVALSVTVGVSGSGPQLIALYEFYEGTPTPPAMVGHWPMDDAGGGGSALTAGVSMQNRLYMYSDSMIDSYSSTAGAYGPSNSGSDAYLTIDATTNARIQMTASSSIKGNVDVGPGGDPSTVIQSSSSIGITGSTGSLGSTVGFPSLSAPSGMPATLGNTTYNGGAILIDSDRTFTDLTLNGGAVVTISGNVRIDVKDDLALNSGSQIVLAPGATLELYVADKVDLNSGSIINPDTSKPASLSLYMYGSNSDMVLNNSSYISGIVYVADVLTLSSGSAIYGGVWADNQITMNSGGVAIHIDTDLIGGMTVADSEGGNNGSQSGDVTAGVAGNGDGGTAIDFDGVDDYIEVAHSDAYLLDNGSLSFWFYSDNLSGHHGLVSKDSLNLDTGGHLHVYTDGSVLKARLQSTSTSYEVQSTGLSTGTWYHVVVSWGSGGLKLFRDGVERDTDSYTGGLGTTSGDIGNYEPMVFGACIWNSGDLTASPVENYFDGRIDDVRIYDQGLDESQADELYNGGEPSGGVGNVVYDTGGYGMPLDLDIENTGAIAWVPGGGLTLSSATRISSAAATKLYDALTATNQFSVEVKFTPANTSQSGPARIVSYSGDASDTNFTFGQDADAYVARLDTTSTTSAGTPEADAGSTLSAGVEAHVILSYDGSNITMYNSDGTSTTLARTGDLDWDNTFGLLMGNETVDGYAWLGTLSRVAIYDQAFNQTQADNVFNDLPPGDGSASGGAGGIDWIEP
jgi:hypothetical protein